LRRKERPSDHAPVIATLASASDGGAIRPSVLQP